MKKFVIGVIAAAMMLALNTPAQANGDFLKGAAVVGGVWILHEATKPRPPVYPPPQTVVNYPPQTTVYYPPPVYPGPPPVRVLYCWDNWGPPSPGNPYGPPVLISRVCQ